MEKADNKPLKKITIPEPCHENWGNMTPKEKGRHCDQCDKVVVDFTNHTQEEIVDHLENAEGKTCGRFKKEQIHKPKTTAKMGKIAASIMAIVGAQAADAQIEEPIMIGEIVEEPIVETDTLTNQN